MTAEETHTRWIPAWALFQVRLPAGSCSWPVLCYDQNKWRGTDSDPQPWPRQQSSRAQRWSSHPLGDGAKRVSSLPESERGRWGRSMDL